jgi:hypothetical protein
MNEFNFNWNYRIVNATTENGSDDWYALREVFYDDLGKPIGHSAPCVGSEDMDSLRMVWQMMQEAMENPPLQEEDFVRKGDAA